MGVEKTPTGTHTHSHKGTNIHAERHRTDARKCCGAGLAEYRRLSEERGKQKRNTQMRGADNQGDSGFLDRWSLSNRRVSKNMAAGLPILLKHAHTQ